MVDKQAMEIFMEYDFETIVKLFKHFCSDVKVLSDHNEDYVKSNCCRHLVKYLEGK